MEKYISKEWSDFLNSSIKELLQMEPVQFSGITPSILPMKAGVYLIIESLENIENALYVSRTKNLRQRLYSNHLMGSTSNARLKKYIIHDENHSCYGDVIKAKAFIRANCQVRWIFLDDTRIRGAIEGYFTSRFFPKYGIAEEH